MEVKQAVLLLFLGCLGERSLCDNQCPISCYCDDKNEYVSCVGDGQWGGLPSIPITSTRLELKNYEVRTLSITNLEGLELLKELKLQEISLESIEDRAFMKLNKLLELDLSRNSLVILTNETFQGLGILRHLDLSSNLLKHIEEAFVSLGKLEQLNLRSNQLNKLTARTFLGLLNMQHLNLDDNKITNIEVEAFRDLRYLAHLILSNNPMVTLSRLDFHSPRLQYMDLSHANLEKAPTSLSKFIRDLRLAKNNITSIKKGDFDNYEYMGLLVLDDNMIANIEDGAWKRHEYLLKLWLNGNRLEKIPFDLPTSVRALYLEENLIRDIPDHSFHGLINLEQLFMQRNRIQNISICGFCGLKNLNILGLQANSIQTLPDGLFSDLTALETLDLSQNDIKVMNSGCFLGLQNLLTLQIARINNDIPFNESVFDNLKSLETLEMYDSSKFTKRLLNSSHILHNLQNLKVLDIMRNDITELPIDFQSYFPHLEEIKLSENRWNCTADILWLSRWMKTTPRIFIDVQNIVCSTPPELEKLSLISLTEDYFTTKSQLDETEPPSQLSSISATLETELTTENKTLLLPDKTEFISLPTTEINNKIPYIAAHVDEIELNPIENISESTNTFTFWEYQVSNPLLAKVRENESTLEPPITIFYTPSLNIVRKITRENWTSNIILISCSVSACFIALIAILVGIAIYRRNKKHRNNLSHASASSSIAYYPYKDEILTAFDKTNDAATCNGIGNKLYYIEDYDSNECR